MSGVVPDAVPDAVSGPPTFVGFNVQGLKDFFSKPDNCAILPSFTFWLGLVKLRFWSKSPFMDKIQKCKSLLVFDWDDTLCPSSWIRSESGQEYSHAKLARLKSIESECMFLNHEISLMAYEQKLIDFFTRLLQLANNAICIVTNAQQGWLEYSCFLYMPKFSAFLAGHPEIGIKSARPVPSFESVFSQEDIIGWKTPVYKSLFELCPEKHLQVIFLDDSFTAIRSIAGACTDINRTYSIGFLKMKTKPTLPEVCAAINYQLLALIRCIRDAASEGTDAGLVLRPFAMCDDEQATLNELLKTV
jgi:hypothetical protein